MSSDYHPNPAINQTNVLGTALASSRMCEMVMHSLAEAHDARALAASRKAGPSGDEQGIELQEVAVAVE